jgi:hypothetical protein
VGAPVCGGGQAGWGGVHKEPYGGGGGSSYSESVCYHWLGSCC